ncbi:hypothetical protein [uncultured Bradyrhizobium sp.]|nr:hypothetical protein [uncultured Bradyrhizobium sp.]
MKHHLKCAGAVLLALASVGAGSAGAQTADIKTIVSVGGSF